MIPTNRVQSIPVDFHQRDKNNKERVIVGKISVAVSGINILFVI
jgi:hypothetical protein